MEELSGKVSFPVQMDYYIAAGNQDSLDTATVIKEIVDEVVAGPVVLEVHAVHEALAEGLVGHGAVPVLVGGAVLLELVVVEVELVGDQDSTTMWYNGAYTITEYIMSNTKTLTKNPAYWDKDCYLFDTVTYLMVEDALQAQNLSVVNHGVVVGGLDAHHLQEGAVVGAEGPGLLLAELLGVVVVVLRAGHLDHLPDPGQRGQHLPGVLHRELRDRRGPLRLRHHPPGAGRFRTAGPWVRTPSTPISSTWAWLRGRREVWVPRVWK